MSRLTTMACLGATLGLLLGGPGLAGAGKPDKPGKPGNDVPRTQACTLVGDANGSGTVGVDAKSHGPLTMTVGGTLDEVFMCQYFSPEEEYSGQGRVLKKQGRLDFWFDETGSDCRPRDWGEPFGEGICRYRLILYDGLFDRKGDQVFFENARAELWDNLDENGGVCNENFTAGELLVAFH